MTDHALRAAIEAALPCYDDGDGEVSPYLCRPTHSHDCPAHFRGKAYAALAPLVASLRAELAAAKADGERIDWLDEHCTYVGGGSGGIYSFSTPADVESGMLRHAIDEARAAQAKEGSNDVG